MASRAASTLASGKTMTVAVICPFIERWYFSQVVAAVEAALRRGGFDTLLIGLSHPTAEPREPFEPAKLRGRADAVVVVTVPFTGAELDGVGDLGLPTVFVGAAVPGAMSVRIDDIAAARCAVDHLLGLGHSRIGFIGGDVSSRVMFTAPADRRAGWMAALRDVGHEPDASYDSHGDFTAAGGLSAATAMLGLPTPPTAIFAASDEMAFGVLIAASRLRLRVPEDLSVVGIDGHEHSAIVGLTTVDQSVRKHGRLAAELLLGAVLKQQPRSQEHVVLPVLLRRGTSSGPASSAP